MSDSYITQATIAETLEIADSLVLTAIELDVAMGVNGNGLLRSFMPPVASSGLTMSTILVRYL